MNLPQINVLIVFSNPIYEKSNRRFDQEDKEIYEAIKRSKYSEKINVNTCHATTVRDLQRALLEKDYHIVQISGHGDKNGLVMENGDGKAYLVPQKALAELFAHFTSSLECVILNSCYSLKQGQLIALSIPYTIAMEEAVGDKAAIEFITAFYDTLGAGRDIEFAYKMGCSAVHLLRLNSIWSPKLLRAGESWESTTEHSESSSYPVNILVGVALDLSGSMLSSIENKSSDEQSNKLEALRGNLEQLGKDAKLAIKKRNENNLQTSIDVFIYGFGLRNTAVCDLLSLIEEACKVFPKEKLYSLKQNLRQKIDHKYNKYKGLEDIAKKDFGLGGFVDEFMGLAEMRANAEISRAISREVKKGLENKLNHLGETTLSIENLMELLKRSDELFGYSEELIYGDTPLDEALTEISVRFDKELKRRTGDITSVLLIVSDGKSSSDIPLPIIDKLQKELKITVVSCLITNQDITNSRTLVGNLELIDKANPGAKLMFDIASELDMNHRFTRFFLNSGWMIEENAKLFAQVNHSQVLDEFIRVILNPLDE
jgi:hypothetical protein